jgi:hypothetical protein
MEHTLKDKLRAAAQGGNVQLGSADITGTPVDRQPIKPVSGPVDAAVPVAASKDVLLNQAANTETATALSDTAERTSLTASGNLVQDTAEFTAEQITITDDDREAFLDALIGGKRFYRPFSLFGGRVTGEFRCRTAKESEALAEWMNAGIREKRYAAAFDYSIDLRNALLATQVNLLQGTAYAELMAPLLRTQTGSETVQPGWLEQAAHWSTQPEALINGVYEELRLFEKRYWTMVMHARNQDFWQPARTT